MNPTNGAEVYIENRASKKVLETTDGTVIEKPFEEQKVSQLWIKSKPNAEHYFTLKNSESHKFLTAMSPRELQIKGTVIVYLRCYL